MQTEYSNAGDFVLNTLYFGSVSNSEGNVAAYGGSMIFIVWLHRCAKYKDSFKSGHRSKDIRYGIK